METPFSSPSRKAVDKKKKKKKRLLLSWFFLFEHDHRIQHIQIRVGVKFRLKQTISTVVSKTTKLFITPKQHQVHEILK